MCDKAPLISIYGRVQLACIFVCLAVWACESKSAVEIPYWEVRLILHVRLRK